MDTNPQSEKPPRFENIVWWVFLICGLAGLAVVLTYLLVETYKLGRRDPIYQGKRLSSWMMEANSGSWPRQNPTPADQAILQIGTNGFPMVAQLLRSRDSTLKSKLLKLYYRQSFIRLHIPTAYDHHSCALAACWALGSEAKPLVPAVAKALNHMDPYFRPGFELWLQQFGSDADAAVPALITILEDKKNPTRPFVAQTLGKISMQRRREVIPVLTACRQDTNAMVRFWAEEALKELGAPQQTTGPDSAP
jgi:hypothetical protein